MNSQLDTRERILDVARDLFTRNGFDTISVRDIVAAAKVNLGAVTYHFGSKKALYHAAIESIADPFAARIAELAAGPGTPLDRIEAIVRGALAHLGEHPGAPTVLLRELATDRPLPPPMLKLMRRNIGAVSTLIQEGQRDGSIRHGDPVLLALSVIPQGFFLIAARRALEPLFQITAAKPKTWAHVVDHVVESVRHTIATTPRGRS